MEPHSPPRRKSLLLAKIAILLAGVVVALLAGEIALRILKFKYVIYPDKIEFGWPDPKEFDNVYVPDKDLMWTRGDYQERLAEARDKRVDVVFMGCSCTEFGSYDQRLAEEIEQQHPGETISYLNAGVGGWTSYQGLAQLKRDILPLKPKVVMIYYGWNDHWFGFGVPDKDIHSYSSSWLYPLRNIRLVQLITKSVVAAKQSGDANHPPRVSPEDFRANLTQMVELAKANGITPVLLTAPTSYRPGREYAYLARRWMSDPSQVIPTHDLYAHIVRDVAEKEGTPLVDLKERFDELPPTDVVRKYFQMDSIHLRAEGEAILADTLYDSLESQGIIEKMTTPENDPDRIALTGRGYPGGGAPSAPPQTGHDPLLPTILEFDKVKYSQSRGTLKVRGWAIAGSPIDHVVIMVNGQNMGAANYPLCDQEFAAKHPEYNDCWAEFAFERPLPKALRKQTLECEAVAYSGNEVVARIPFPVED